MYLFQYLKNKNLFLIKKNYKMKTNILNLFMQILLLNIVFGCEDKNQFES